MAEAAIPAAVPTGSLVGGALLGAVARQRELSLVVVMVVLGAFVFTQAPQFLSASNLTQVTAHASIIAVAAVGEAIVIMRRSRPTPRASRGHCASALIHRSDGDAWPSQGNALRLRRCRGVRQRPDRHRRERARRGDHQSAADGAAPRSTEPGSKAICPRAGRPKSTATASCWASPSRALSQRYVFDDVQLLYGENRIQIILYGPQGQVRTRDELINVGKDNVPPGKTWYWAGFNQPGQDVLRSRSRPIDGLPKRRRPSGRAWHRRTHLGRRACARDARSTTSG